MPRSTDPATITRGAGRVPRGAVEDNSLRNPDRDTLPLQAHINDPNKAHYADTIYVEDAANNFVADEVEGALAELAGGSSSGRSNGWIAGGTWTSAALNLTMDTPSTAKINGVDHPYSGASVALTDNNVNYVYIDSTTALLTAALAPPTLASEDVLVAEVTTAGGVVTGSRDGRFFVLNLDRKPPLTLRTSGGATNAPSEGAFITLEAALLYLELFASLGGASEAETHRIIVRGKHTVAATHVLPVGGIIFEGDGDASFDTGASLAPMFDLNGLDNCQFKDLQFITSHVATAFVGSASAVSHCIIERCQLIDAGVAGGILLNLTDAAADNVGCIVRDCSVSSAFTVVHIARGEDCLVDNVTATSAGALSTTRAAFEMNSLGTGRGRCVITNCNADVYGIGAIWGGPDVTIKDSVFTGGYQGIIQAGAAASGVTIKDCRIALDSADDGALVTSTGITILSGNQHLIRGCRIDNPRAVWTASAGIITVGIEMGAAANADQTRIVDCQITGFFNDTLADGIGIRVLTAEELQIQGTSVTDGESAIRLNGACPRFNIAGGTLKDALRGLVVVSAGSIDGEVSQVKIDGSRYGMASAGTSTRISDCNIRLSDTNDATGAELGVSLTGDLSQVSDTTIQTARAAWTTPGGQIPAGVALTADRCSVKGCTINGMHNSLTDEGFGVELTVAVDTAQVSGNFIAFTSTGVSAFDGSRKVLVSGNEFAEITAAGVHFLGAILDSSILDNTIDGLLAAAVTIPTCVGVHLEAAPGAVIQNAKVDGNTITRCREGVISTGDLTDNNGYLTISNNTIHHCAHDTVIADTFAGSGSKGIGLDHVRTATISGNLIHDIGHTVDNAGAESFPGANVSSTGIYIRNCTRVSSEGNTLRNMVSNGTGRGGGIDYQQRTAGLGPGITFTAGNHGISDNSVTWDTAAILPGNDEGQIGIQVSMDLGGDNATANHVMSGVVIADNRIDRTQALGINVEAGDRCSLTQVKVDGNIVLNPALASPANSAGIRVKSTDNTVAGPTTLSDVKVSNNSVEGSPTEGILALFEATTSSTHRVDIAGNTVLSPASNGIRVDAGSVGMTVSECSVVDNQIKSAGGEGILITVSDKGATALNQIIVSRNRVADSGSQGIFFDSDETDLSDIDISDNEVVAGTSGIGFLANGTVNTDLNRITVEGNRVRSGAGFSAFYITNNGLITELTVADNQFTGSGALPCFYINNDVTVVMTGESHENIVVTGNLIKDGEGALIELEHTAGVGNAAGKLRNLTFSDNTVETSGDVGFNLQLYDATAGADPAAQNIKVEGNTFRACTNDGVVLGLGRAAGGGDIDAIENVSVSGNNFENCRAASADNDTLHIRTDGAGVNNIRVDNNSFKSCGFTDETTSGIVNVLLGRPSGTINNVSVDGNQFQLCIGVGILVQDNPNAVVSSVESLSIKGNKIKSQNNTAILVDMSTMAAASCQGVDISGNQIDTVTGGAANRRGIHVISPASSAWVGLTIASNQISSTDEGGILVELDADISGMDISRNSLEATGGHSIEIIFDSISVFGAMINDNIIDDSSQQGIYWNTFGVGGGDIVENLQICGNQIFSPANYGILVDGVDVYFRGLSVDRNQIHTPSAMGIFVELASTALFVTSGRDIFNLSVCDNQVYLPTGRGIRVDFASTTDGKVMYGGQICRNVVTGGTYGLHITPLGEVRQLDVCDNILRNFTLFGLFIEADGNITSTEDFQSVKVSGNTFRSGTAGHVACRLELEAIVSSTQICNNIGHGGSTASDGLSLSLGVVPGNLGVGDTMLIMGNSFRAYTGAGTSVVDPGTISTNWTGGVVVTNSTCSNNTSNDGGAAGFLAAGWTLVPMAIVGNNHDF